MSKQISIRKDLYNELKNTKGENKSFSDAIQELIDSKKDEIKALEATITQEGRITKTLAGKTILYRIKQDNAKVDTTMEEEK